MPVEKDEVIVPTLTFCSTSNVMLFQGARPVIADVLDSTLCIDPESVYNLVTERTKAVLCVDY